MVEKEDQFQSISSLDTALTLPSDMSGGFYERQLPPFDGSHEDKNHQRDEVIEEGILSHDASTFDDSQGISLAERRIRIEKTSSLNCEEHDMAEDSSKSDQSSESDYNSSLVGQQRNTNMERKIQRQDDNGSEVNNLFDSDDDSLSGEQVNKNAQETDIHSDDEFQETASHVEDTDYHEKSKNEQGMDSESDEELCKSNDQEESTDGKQKSTTNQSLLNVENDERVDSEGLVQIRNEQQFDPKYQDQNSQGQSFYEDVQISNHQQQTEMEVEDIVDHEQRSNCSGDLVYEQQRDTIDFAKVYREYEEYVKDEFLKSKNHAEFSGEENLISEKFNGVVETVRKLIGETKGENEDYELVWNACISKNCSNQLLQIIGGTTGNVLAQLTVTELLDAVSVTEQFREKMEGKYPNILSKRSSNPQIQDVSIPFDSHDTFSLVDAIRMVTLGNNVTWEVHRLILDEFMLILREQSKNWIEKAYNSRHEINRTESGHIITSLSQDVFSLVSVKLRIIRESLTGTSEALVMAACAIFGQLQSEQRRSRERFLKDFDLCCATANDFSRMSDVVEDVSFEFIDRSGLNQEHRKMLEDAVGSLVSLYGNDAVYAARSAYKFIMEPIEKSLRKHLFGKKWESDLTNNEIALKMTRTLNDFDNDLAEFLDDFFVTKILAATVRAVTFFYIKCLLIKADQYVPRKNHYRGFFESNCTAMNRIEDDIRILREHFLKKAESNSHLKKAIESEFGLLVVIHELFCIAAGYSDGNPVDYAIVLYKHVHDQFLTRLIMCDIWHLANPIMERYIWQLDLNCIGSMDKEEFKDDLLPSGLDPTYFFSNLYSKCERRRPIGIMERRSVASKIREIVDLTC